ncbi:Fungal Zn2-Cys6 binuclear cluster domain-containing protein [Cladophialophora immunda]|nr:Fungal Zn2-Cys6 binuclear cluster domain-containing protein [Cladophialophora immunda]
MPSPNKIEDPCQECRDRHLKCDNNFPKCKQCERSGERCRRGNGKLKFRVGSSARYDASFSKDQTWLEQTKNAKFQFIDQGPELENYYSQDDIVVTSTKANAQDERQENAAGPPKRLESSVEAELSPTVRSAPSTDLPPFLSPFNANNESVLVHSPIKRRRTADAISPEYQTHPNRLPNAAYDPIRSQYRIYDFPKVFSSTSADGFPYMPEQHQVPKVVEAEYRRLADSAAATIPEDPLLSPAIWKEEFYWPNQYTTTQCACLMRYYIENLAPWFDVGDPARHFTLAVPQRARRNPPLLNAIFTLAARHLASLPRFKTADGVIQYQNILLPKLTEDTAVKYHNACIAYLIKLSSDPEHVRDEDLLAAAVILRYYEEIDPSLTNEDSKTLIHTFQLFANAQANPYAYMMNDDKHPEYLRPGSAVGLFENALAYLKSFQHASFRVALRQELTIAFLRQRPVRLPLETWTILQGFDEAEDFIWSDRHLYHCAKVLQFCFGGDGGTGKTQIEQWNELRNFEIQWDQFKPLSFAPIHYQVPNRSKGECLPHIWYMAEVHATGLLALDLARILLTVYNPNIPRIGPGVTAAQKRIADEVHDIVIQLCGTAMSLGGTAASNASSQPAMVQAYMAVVVCGEYFSDPLEQRALMGILDRLRGEHGWPTGKTAMQLKREWGWI